MITATAMNTPSRQTRSETTQKHAISSGPHHVHVSTTGQGGGGTQKPNVSSTAAARKTQNQQLTNKVMPRHPAHNPQSQSFKQINICFRVARMLNAHPQITADNLRTTF
jgi:hypothetical protein